MSNQSQTINELLRVPDAAKLLGVCRNQVYKMIRQGELGKVQMCSEWRVPMKDILDYCDKNYSRKEQAK